MTESEMRQQVYAQAAKMFKISRSTVFQQGRVVAKMEQALLPLADQVIHWVREARLDELTWVTGAALRKEDNYVIQRRIAELKAAEKEPSR